MTMNDILSKITRLHPKPPQRVWHGLYFLSLYDSEGMSEDQAAQKLRHLAEQIGQR
jgi:hypothetical protein